jgi:hypothetical protein
MLIYVYFLGPSDTDIDLRNQLHASLADISESETISDDEEDEDYSRDNYECSTGSHGSVIEELHSILDSLYELSPGLHRASEKLPTTSLLEPVSSTTFHNVIRDKFPAAPPYLVTRFADSITITWKTLLKRCSESKQEASDEGL